MERTKWTDDMLDERLATVDKQFAKLSGEIASLRKEMLEGFAGLRAEMQAGFAALRAEMAADRAQVSALHRQLNTMMGTALVAALGLLGVLVAKL